MSENGCGVCDGQGFVFRHQGSDVFMENCSSCNQIRSAEAKGFWLSVGWKPSADSPPGLKEWSARIIEENAGTVTLRPLDPGQLSSICSSQKLNILWTSVVVLSTELAREKAATEGLRRRVEALEGRGLFAWVRTFFRRVLGT